MAHISPVYKHLYGEKILCFFSVILLGFLIFVSPLIANAAGVPTILSYQGRLTDVSGNLLGGSGTTYYFKFSLWDSSVVGSGTRLWPSYAPSATAVTVKQGVFNVNIGDTANGYPDALNYNFSSSTIYLQVEVSLNGSSFETLSPRQSVTSSAFAQVSGAVRGTGQSTFGTTTPLGTAVVSVQATSPTTPALSLQAFFGQIANIFQIQDSAGNNLFSVDSAGNVFASSTLNVSGVNAQLNLSQPSSPPAEFYVDPTGDVQLSSPGGNFRMQNENLWVCSGGSCGVDTPPGEGNIIVENSVIFDNKFKLEQVDASTTVMYDTTGDPIFEFDEGQ